MASCCQVGDSKERSLSFACQSPELRDPTAGALPFERCDMHERRSQYFHWSHHAHVLGAFQYVRAMFLRSKGFVHSEGTRYLASCEFHHADDSLVVEAPNCVTSSRVKTIRSLENVMYANRCVQDFCGLVTHERCTQFNLR